MSAEPQLPADMEAVADEFVARLRRGEQPSVSEYVRAHPALEDEIREVFPVLSVMEAARVDDTWAPGMRTLGDYDLIREVGRGGMGVVYEAVQRTLGRRVALKLLPAQATADPRYLERFRQEATAAARLQHPGIVPVIGLEQHEGIHYYAMQLIDGRGLDLVVDALGAARSGTGESDCAPLVSALHSQEVGSSSFSALSSVMSVVPSAGEPSERMRYYRNIARMGLQAAEALAYAHAQGVLHRDVKPANFLLDKAGKVWITDFGLCKDVEADGLTQTGDMLGTLRYVPPERLEGTSDVRGDIYGLGATLYELLGRETLFAGADRAQLVQLIANETPKRLRRLDRHIPADLEVIVGKAMARDPTQRYATAEALALDLRAFLGGRPVAARPPSLTYTLRMAVRRHRALAVSLAVAGVVLLASSIFYVRDLRERERTARRGQYVATIAAAETALRDDDVQLARRLLKEAPRELRNFEWHHFHSQLDGYLHAYPSTGARIADVAYSPSGAHVAVCARDHLRIYAVGSEDEALEVPFDGSVRTLAWHPTRDLIVVGGMSEEVLVVDVVSGEIHARIKVASGVEDACFAAERLVVADNDHYIRVFDVETGESLEAWSAHTRVYCVSASEDGSRIVSGAWNGAVSVWQFGEEQPVWSRAVHTHRIIDVVFVGDDLVAASVGDAVVQVMDAASGQTLRALPGTRTGALAVDAREQRLAVADGRAVSIWDPRTGAALRRVRHGRDVSAVSFSRAGDRLVTGSLGGTLKEWDVSRRGAPDVLRGHLDDLSYVAEHPDGRMIAVGGGGPVIHVWDTETQEIARTWFGDTNWVIPFAYSADGKYVLARARSDAVLWDMHTGRIIRRFQGHTGDLTRAAFVDGERKIATTAVDGDFSVWDAASGTRLQHEKVPGGGVPKLAALPDGDRIAVGAGDGKLRLWSIKRQRWIHTLDGHAGAIEAIAASRDGGRIVTVGRDKSMRVWDVEAGTHHTFMTGDPELSWLSDTQGSVTFSPDGSRIATGGRDGLVRIWGATEGNLICTLAGHHGWVGCVLFSNDGSRLYSCAGGGTVRIWDTRSLRARAPAIRGASTRQRLAAPLFQKLLEEAGGDTQAALVALQSSSEWAPDARESVLRLAHAHQIEDEVLVARLWRLVADPEADQEDRTLAVALAEARWRAVGHQGFQDGRAGTQAGLASFRGGWLSAATFFFKRAASLNAPTAPDLLALDLAFLTWTNRLRERTENEATTRAQLDALLESGRAVRTPRSEALLDEALEALR